jgi:hypothetical protein
MERYSTVIREMGLRSLYRDFRINADTQKNIDAIQSGDFGVDASYQNLTSAWMGALGNKQGVFFAVLARLLCQKVPLHAAIGIASGYVPGGIYSEAKAIVLNRMTFGRDRLTPKTAAGLAVVTREALEAVDPAAQQSLEDATSMGVIASVDGDIYNDVTGSAYPGDVASGSTAVDATKDMRGALLNVFAPGQPTSKGFWACSARTAIALAACGTSGGQQTFPDATPTGGSLLGLPLIPSPAWGDALTLFDGGQIAAGALGLAVDASTAGAYSAALDPSQNAGLGSGPEQLVSAFQSGSVAFRTLTAYAFALARETACYTIAGSEAYGS